jgi:aspartokinase-like uncharacterized kinase
MENSTTIVNELIAYFEGKSGNNNHAVLIIPGGGEFANTVRTVDNKYHLSDAAAHWMAILSMEQYAYFIADNSKTKTTDNIEAIDPGVSVLLPYRLIKETDELEHSWNITSDTIGAWVAKKTNAAFIKVTDVDGVFEDDMLKISMTAEELALMGTTCIDSSLADFLKNNKMNCVVVNGKHPERVIDAVIGKQTIATYIKGNI